MFDFLSFVRQLLPPTSRTPVTLALIQLLFKPVMYVFTALANTRDALISDAQATGQTAVLEVLVNQAITGTSVGAAYILEGDQASVDFQVIVPPDLSAETYQVIDKVVRRHKLAGKRYELRQSPRYAPTATGPAPVLVFVAGFPYTTSPGKISFAVNQTGDYQVVVTRDDGTVVYNGNQRFAGPTDVHLLEQLDESRTYVLTIGDTLNRTISFPKAVVETISAGYSFTVERNLFVGFNALTAPSVTLSPLNGATGTAQVAGTFGQTFAGTGYTYRLVYSNLVNGTYKIVATTANSSFTGYVVVSNNVVESLMPTTPPTPAATNQAPTVAQSIPTQNATVGVPFSVQLPAGMFADADGTIQSMAVTGLWADFSYNASTRTISGTATSTGTDAISVTGTDDQGASVATSFLVIVAAAPSSNTSNGTGSGGSGLSTYTVYSSDASIHTVNRTVEGSMIRLTITPKTASGNGYTSYYDDDQGRIVGDNYSRLVRPESEVTVYFRRANEGPGTWYIFANPEYREANKNNPTELNRVYNMMYDRVYFKITTGAI